MKYLVVLSLLCLTGCAGVEYRPNGGTEALAAFLGSGSSVKPQARRTYNCQSRSIINAFGEVVRTETECEGNSQ